MSNDETLYPLETNGVALVHIRLQAMQRALERGQSIDVVTELKEVEKDLEVLARWLAANRDAGVQMKVRWSARK